MSNKIFVGGLSWDTTSDGLSSAFQSFGNISDSKVVTDRETGRSRGFGFVTFDSSDAANEAVSNMDGQEIDGRSVKVNIAIDRPRNNRNSDRRW